MAQRSRLPNCLPACCAGHAVCRQRRQQPHSRQHRQQHTAAQQLWPVPTRGTCGPSFGPQARQVGRLWAQACVCVCGPAWSLFALCPMHGSLHNNGLLCTGPRPHSTPTEAATHKLGKACHPALPAAAPTARCTELPWAPIPWLSRWAGTQRPHPGCSAPLGCRILSSRLTRNRTACRRMLPPGSHADPPHPSCLDLNPQIIDTCVEPGVAKPTRAMLEALLRRVPREQGRLLPSAGLRVDRLFRAACAGSAASAAFLQCRPPSADGQH